MKNIFTPLILSSLFLLNGCYYLQPTTLPISHHVIDAPQIGKRVMLLLPGIGDLGDSFEKNDFDRVVQEKFPNIEVVTVDAHFKYYNQRTLLTRLKQDLVQPYLDEGYEVYISGISLGGLGSLLYFQEYPDDIEKVLILAPFLGEEIEYQYLIDGTERPEAEMEIDLWPWITTLNQQQRDKIYLAYGLQDKFAPANGLFANYLPEDHTIAIDGNHRWNTWGKLWPQLLDRAF